MSHNHERNFLDKMSSLVCVILALSLIGPLLFAGGDEITVAAVGDCVISRKVSTEKDRPFLELVALLRRADCTYANCETTLYNPVDGLPAWKLLPAPHHSCLPWGADELEWAGIDIVSLANDHIMDFSYEGLSATQKNLERVGIAYAGAGRDLDHAAAPAYSDAAGGTVSLVSCTSFFEIDAQASQVHPHMAGRPGINPLNLDFFVQVEPALFAKLNDIKHDILKAAGIPVEKRDPRYVDSVGWGEELGFVKGDSTGFLLSAKEKAKDPERIYAAIAAAANNSRIVLFALHEPRGGAANRRPTTFQEEFARKCIDAGADMFLGTGAHVPWPLEIYKGKPIFHGLGNFFFHEIRLVTAEAYEKMNLPAHTLDPMKFAAGFDTFLKDERIWESVVPLVTFDGDDNIKEIKLYPIVLGKDAPLERRGTPRLAAGEKAAEILARFKEICNAYGTKIVVEKGVGRVVLVPFPGKKNI